MDEDRKKRGLPAYVPKRFVNSLEVRNVAAAGARERTNNDGLEDYEMTGLMAGSDGDCDVLEVACYANAGKIRDGNLWNFM